MVEKVVMYRAADGSLHENERMAVAVDRAVKMRQSIKNMLVNNCDMSDMLDMDQIEDLARFFIDKRHELLEILK